MLDLGFLEDVERILALTPEQPPDRAVQRDDAAADPQARRPLPLRPGASSRSKSATLTVDSVEQFQLEVKASRQGRQARRGPARRAPRPGDRLRAHEDPLRPALPQAARPRDERQGAARRHVAGLARRRDARASRAGACRSSSPPTSPPAASTSRPSPTSSTTTSRSRPTSTSTASAAPAASGAPAARSRSSSRARRRELEAIEKHIGMRDRRGARARTSRRRRSRRSRAGTPSRRSPATATSRFAKLIAGVGRADGIEVADLVHAVTHEAGPRRRGRPRRAGARALLVSCRSPRARPSASSTRSAGRRCAGTSCASSAPRPVTLRPPVRLDGQGLVPPFPSPMDTLTRQPPSRASTGRRRRPKAPKAARRGRRRGARVRVVRRPARRPPGLVPGVRSARRRPARRPPGLRAAAIVVISRCCSPAARSPPPTPR